MFVAATNADVAATHAVVATNVNVVATNAATATATNDVAGTTDVLINLFNISLFTGENRQTIVIPLVHSCERRLDTVNLHLTSIRKIQRTQKYKSAGRCRADQLHSIIIKTFNETIIAPLLNVFRRSMDTGLILEIGNMRMSRQCAKR